MTGAQALKIVERAERSGMSREAIAARLRIGTDTIRKWPSVRRVRRVTADALRELREQLRTSA